jgi:putative nucleotidyltransferase with HDIG domain
MPLRAGGDLVGLLALHRVTGSPQFTPAQAKALAIIGAGAAVAIKNARLYNSLQEQYLATVRSLVAAVEAKDPYTSGHSEMVSRYASWLARAAGLEEEQVDAMRVAGLLHDAGKIGVPEAILLKKGSLTAEEYEVIKEHVVISERIVEPLKLPEHVMRPISEHHERLDGTGYPRGLSEDQISIWGRIMAIADCFEALISDRVYRSRMSDDEALGMLEKMAPRRLDADLVALMEKIIRSGQHAERRVRDRAP